ncbi:hypothetical protein Cadr_000006310 [Camelus dromedarius]|uniref:Uncharacterized protein n=1 Tax=Camelus dromedarius TaxID=9838 RepID=A0A5N4E164_CAMDR|nr:hypothetical protein Cadr_000006310 [Camelus dromedarius]
MTPHESYNLSLCMTSICQSEQSFRGQKGSPGDQFLTHPQFKGRGVFPFRHVLSGRRAALPVPNSSR